MNAEVIVIAECCCKGQREGFDLAAEVYRGGKVLHCRVQARHLHGRSPEQLNLGHKLPAECTAEAVKRESWIVLVRDGRAVAGPANQWRALL